MKEIQMTQLTPPPSINPAVAAPAILTPTLPSAPPANLGGVQNLSTSKPRGVGFYVPSNWHLEPTEGGVKATNNSTGDVFEGTQKEFSAMLRGM